jgi:hypothetical protein
VRDADRVDTPSTVEMAEATVREMRVRFTGADCFKGPVEVRAYGRLIGHWFPPGTLPAGIAPSRSSAAADRERQPDPRLLPMRPGSLKRQPAPTTPTGSVLSEKQRQRDEWLRKMSRSTRKGSGY